MAFAHSSVPAKSRIPAPCLDDRVSRVIRSARLALAALLLASCSPPPAAPFRAPAPFPVIAQHESLRGYRLAESFVATGPFRDGAPLRVGAIVNGLRVRPDASGLRVAASVSVPPLQGGVPPPEALGGGLLFWNDSALYTARFVSGHLDAAARYRLSPGARFVWSELCAAARQWWRSSRERSADASARAAHSAAVGGHRGDGRMPGVGVARRGHVFAKRGRGQELSAIGAAGGDADSFWPLPEPPLEHALWSRRRVVTAWFVRAWSARAAWMAGFTISTSVLSW